MHRGASETREALKFTTVSPRAVSSTGTAAAPDQDLVQLTIDEGEVTWLEPVTDAVFKAALGKK